MTIKRNVENNENVDWGKTFKMEKQLLIQNRNVSLIKLLWIFYMIHTIVYMVIDQQVDHISPFAGLLFLFPITFLSYKKRHPFLTMYAIIVVYYSYITYLLVLEPLLANLIFLLLGIILTIVYQQAKAIIVSSFLSLSLLIYFFTTTFDRLHSDLTRQDLIYFVLFGLLAAILFLYYTKILSERWTAVHLKARKTEEELHSTQEYLQSFFMFNNDAIAVIDLEGKVIMVNNILREVILLFETECALKNVVIHSHLPVDPCILLCDINQLKQVFINLLKNSIDAMPQGGSIYIRAAKKDEHHMEILIRDTGSGIPPSVLEHIHRPFFTTKESGTGLGLVVTQKIISQHQGSLLISSEQDHGTTVKLTLPLYTEETIPT
jgi:signal transduction histidine kinase